MADGKKKGCELVFRRGGEKTGSAGGTGTIEAYPAMSREAAERMRERMATENGVDPNDIEIREFDAKYVSD